MANCTVRSSGNSSKAMKKSAATTTNYCCLTLPAFCLAAALVLVIAVPIVSAKNLDNHGTLLAGHGHGIADAGVDGVGHSHHHRRSRLQRDSGSKNVNVREQCEAVKPYFESIDIKLHGNYEQKGAVCGGNCCANSTETELRHKATTEFERLLHHHTESLRGILESTANLFQGKCK
ncbi:division abnormally delayed protein-like [Teleopsis dalmanni]|uniref:division abnormally delayed protein-like n=1 Tax=Teleopsis dalmanni TaxID=139649 RepID=UPI0018CDCE42|nr:division abnormally delayed protein-like [Teleopsis dalmanni]